MRSSRCVITTRRTSRLCQRETPRQRESDLAGSQDPQRALTEEVDRKGMRMWERWEHFRSLHQRQIFLNLHVQLFFLYTANKVLFKRVLRVFLLVLRWVFQSAGEFTSRRICEASDTVLTTIPHYTHHTRYLVGGPSHGFDVDTSTAIQVPPTPLPKSLSCHMLHPRTSFPWSNSDLTAHLER